jgi:hypothetical protein
MLALPTLYLLFGKGPQPVNADEDDGPDNIAETEHALVGV